MSADAGTSTSLPPVVTFSEARVLGPEVMGTKAANLVRLHAVGLPVPAGLVVLPEADQRWEEAAPLVTARAAALGAERFAVRSSATAEDLEGASFAGQYESLLDVPPDQLSHAVRQVFASTRTERAVAYQRTRAGGQDTAERVRMAVLLQPLVDADAAGVAFTANPLTGDRGEVLVTAVCGLGERLVSGAADGDEWIVRDGRAARTVDGEQAITAPQAIAIAELARRVEPHFGVPQDIEWAISGDRLYLLQARPMTALPESVEWTPPYPGWWMRNFRLGEWLPDPVTPLFADWLLPRIEAGFVEASTQDVGIRHVPGWAVINGWYYVSPTGRESPPRMLLHVLRHPRALRWIRAFLIDPGRHPERADAHLARTAARWRDELLPHYRSAIEQAQRDIESASRSQVARMIDGIGELAGGCLWSLSSVGGSAWKIEGVLARFFREHLAGKVDFSHQVLLSGLPGTPSGRGPHAVYSADWYWPTAGEEAEPRDEDADERRRTLVARRLAAETACREALAGTPELRERFDQLLALAQRYAVIREQQANSFTLAWPLLRHAVIQLAEHLAGKSALPASADAFFLTRAELLGAVESGTNSDLATAARSRRTDWERQRRLLAPLEFGRPPRLARQALRGALDAARTGRETPADAIVGHPASPGHADGPVRIIRGPDEFSRIQPGDVLVAPTTAPAWTPLFARAAAVVTDGGSLAAHASLVAREYGIPAVVATGDATTRLHNGQRIHVDGNAGTVSLRDERVHQPNVVRDGTDATA
jgi:rifampicin phosphotransferase